jgi:hypothetical protein
MPKLRQLMGGAAVALLAAGCGSDPYYYGANGPYYVSSSYYPYHGDRYVYERRIEYVNGRVTSIQAVRGDPAWRGHEVYRVVVQDPGGVSQTYVMQSLGSLRVGDLVRIDNGRIYPVG